jgi:uncharacterized PurR-regulated membrane protein YhhQ (DUF165 family)
MLAMSGVIVVSNVLVQYPLGPWLTYGALTYPIAFLITDLVTRNHGLKVAKKVILVGLVAGILASLLASIFDVTTLRIAIASAVAFLVAQTLDVKVFLKLQHLPWWQTPVLSSTIGSVVDTFIFFSVAFSATSYALLADGNVWAQETVQLLGIGREFPLWVSLAVADLGIKLLMVIVLLLPYRYFIKNKPHIIR